MSYPYDPAKGKTLIKSMDAGFVRIRGIPSVPDAEGYTGWIEIEPEVEDERKGDRFGQPLRVNPGLVQLPTRSRLHYGGGVKSGDVAVEYTKRPYVPRVHKLTQYLRRPGTTPIPAGAYGLEVAPGLHSNPSGLAFDLLADNQVLIHIQGVGFQEFYSLGTANQVHLFTTPVQSPSGGQDTYWNFDWYIDV